MRRQIVAFFSDRSRVEDWLKAQTLDDRDYLRLRALYPDEPEKIVDGIFAHPTKTNYWLLFAVLGPTLEIPDEQFLSASIEHFKRHPVRTARAIAATYKGLVLGPAWRFEDNPIRTPLSSNRRHRRAASTSQPISWALPINRRAAPFSGKV